MVVVGREDDRPLLRGGVFRPDDAGDVDAADRPGDAVLADRRFQAERHGHEVLRLGLFAQGLAVELGRGQDAVGRIAGEPPLEQEPGAAVRQKEALVGPRGPQDVPAIGRAFRVMDDEDTRGAERFGLLVLVGPAAVVGHVLAVEDAAGEVPGLVDLDEQDFAREVEALDVVPIPLGRLDEITAIDDLARRLGRRVLALGPDDELVAEDGGDGDVRAADLERRRWVRPRALELERLPVARSEGGLEAHRPEIVLMIAGGELDALCPHGPSLQLVAREIADVGRDLIDRDGLHPARRALAGPKRGQEGQRAEKPGQPSSSGHDFLRDTLQARRK